MNIKYFLRLCDDDIDRALDALCDGELMRELGITQGLCENLYHHLNTLERTE